MRPGVRCGPGMSNLGREMEFKPKSGRRTLLGRLLLLGVWIIAFLTGCTSLSQTNVKPQPSLNATSHAPAPENSIKQVSATEPQISNESAHLKTPANLAFAGMAELSEAVLVDEVLSRNPTVTQMVAAAQAAAARYPQVTSLEDPRLGAIVGPASIGSRDVNFAYRFEISQAIPFPGKLGLRGQVAAGEASASAAEVDDTRLKLTEAARGAFADYYLAARAVEINEENLKLLREFRENALNRYKTAQGEQQDVLQAEVTIARQQERASLLERLRRVAQARINTLLNQAADESLPPPPKLLASTSALPPAAELRELAISRRPDIAAIRARTAADEATLALMQKEYYPDFEAMAAYDAFWQPSERDLRPMLGVRVNLPVQIGRRDAAVTEAQSKLAQRRAELARLVAQIGLEVQEAYEQVRETERSLKLYEETALPKARENVRLARAAYATGKVQFLNLIDAQRNLIELQDREFELRAEALRRRAALDRAAGAKPADLAKPRSTTPPKKDPPRKDGQPPEPMESSEKKFGATSIP